MKHTKLLLICLIVVSLFCPGCKKESSPQEEPNEAVTSTKDEEVTNFLIIDDFESYNDLKEGEPGSNRIYLAWVDGSDNAGVNGSVVGKPFAEQNIVHSGNQSMPMYYNCAFRKSEATLTLTYPRDWTEYGVKTLSIWFRGYSQNAAEPMYVVLNGSAGVDNENPNAAQATAWTEWNIPLKAFADQGVNLSNVNTITIGFGNRKKRTAGGAGGVYFDDIILYRQPKPKTASFALLKAGDVVTNSIGMKLVYIPAGEFMMGSNLSAAQLAREYREYDAPERIFTDEFHQHRVRISEGFWMSQTEVTQGQYKSVMNAQPWSGLFGFQESANNPAVFVIWDEATEFCSKLSRQEGKTYRLPTEAEWEYACRAGTTTRFSFSGSDSSLGDYAWCQSNTYGAGQKYAHSVGQKKPNPWDLYDMHGNVWEWCSDYYDEDYYSNSPNVDPKGPPTGFMRSLRGGSWHSSEGDLRCAARTWYVPIGRGPDVGFRVVRSQP